MSFKKANVTTGQRSATVAPVDYSDAPVVPLRHTGRWIAAVVLLLIAALIVRAFVVGQIDWSIVGHYLTASVIFQGLVNTLVISVTAMVLGTVLGVIFAVMRLSGNPVMTNFARVYIWLFRGTPVLLQLLLWFNLALIFPRIAIPGLFTVRMVTVMTPFLGALLGLGINEGSYMTEIVRAGIISVDQGQTEAAQALGMSSSRTLRRVVLPQAMRVIIPPVGNEFIGLLKNSSLASVIAYSELLYRSQQIYFANERVMELLMVAAIWYLAVVSIFSIGQYYVERRFARGASRALPLTPLQRLRATVRARGLGEGGTGAGR